MHEVLMFTFFLHIILIIDYLIANYYYWMSGWGIELLANMAFICWLWVTEQDNWSPFNLLKKMDILYIIILCGRIIFI